MMQRVLRLTRRSYAVYYESNSRRAAVKYFVNSLFAKFSLTIVHLRALFLFFRPSEFAAKSNWLDAVRADGKLAVSITVSGGLGDMIVIARCLRDMALNVEPFVFDIFASQPELARWVFAAVPNFGQAYPDALQDIASREHDVRLRCNQMLVVHHQGMHWQQLKKAPRFAALLGQMDRYRQRAGLDPFIQHHPRLDNGLARKAVYANHSRIDYLHAIAGVPYRGHKLPVAADDSALVRFNLLSRDFITVHNGFDANFFITGQRATKCYPHFAEVIAGIKAKRSDILVIQIGTVTSEPIPGVDLNLINQTSLREVAGILRATMLHLDNEGGLVHLTACYGRRSLVVFGPTPSDYFGYPENINIDPVQCGGCWWIDELWMDRCPRGSAQPECMFTQPPEKIVAEALAALQPNLTGSFPLVEAGSAFP